jgi:hypothetical protein
MTVQKDYMCIFESIVDLDFHHHTAEILKTFTGKPYTRVYMHAPAIQE